MSQQGHRSQWGQAFKKSPKRDAPGSENEVPTGTRAWKRVLKKITFGFQKGPQRGQGSEKALKGKRVWKRVPTWTRAWKGDQRDRDPQKKSQSGPGPGSKIGVQNFVRPPEASVRPLKIFSQLTSMSPFIATPVFYTWFSRHDFCSKNYKLLVGELKYNSDEMLHQ